MTAHNVNVSYKFNDPDHEGMFAEEGERNPALLVWEEWQQWGSPANQRAAVIDVADNAGLCESCN